MKKILLSVLSLAFLHLNLFALNNQDSFFKDYISRSWNAQDGIPGNTITDIVQSSDGYIYFGTYGGLVRFDGLNFTVMNQAYNNDFSFRSTRSVIQDKRGNLWVGSNDEGVFCIKENGEVISFSTENGLTNNSVRSICEDFENNIWVGTASGINVISKDFKIIKPKGFDTIPENNIFIVNQMYCDTAGRVWILSLTEKSTYIYSENKFEKYSNITSIENPIITTMNQDATGAFWFGVAPHYAVRFFGDEETVYDLSTENHKGSYLNCIFQDKEKNLWFGMDSGITILHDGKFSYINKSSGLADDGVTKIYQDSEKNIWIATDRGGLQKLSNGKFQTTKMSTTINAIAQDLYRGVTWLAGDNGLFCYKNGQFIENDLTQLCKNVRIRHVSVTSEGAVLVSTYEKLGQLKYNLDGTLESWTTENGLVGSRVRVAEQFSNGDIYVGTTSGLSIISPDGTITNITKNEEIQNDYIMCIHEDKDGFVWVGTDGGGIFVLKDKQVVKIITKDDNLSGNVIFKILNLRDDELWICTGTGLSIYKNDQIFSFSSVSGLGYDSVFQVIPDYTQKIWFTTNQGIFNLKLSEIDEVMAGTKNYVNPKFFTRQDGIDSGGVTSTSLSMKDNLGRIWFTLIDGFTIFDPVRNESNNSAPKITIQEVLLDSEKTTFKDNTVILEPSVKRLRINYTGISFISPEQITFKTKLEGFEKDYSEWTNLRIATYTNLEPGTYKFNVVAQNGDEIQSKNVAQLKIIKKPYFYQRPSFMISVLAIVIGVVILIIKMRFDRLNRQKQETEKMSIEVIQALVGTIDAKDKYTNGHSIRVAQYSKMISKALGDSEEEQKRDYYSALLHDIGKMGIPDTIINKPAALTKEEYDIVKTHPEIGSQILRSITTMKEISVGARWHHEHFDGSGYPDKLKGEDIPKIARIIGVADAYDAMTSNRSYRKYLPQEKVRKEFEENKSSQFDSKMAEIMIKIIDEDTDYLLHE